MVATSEKLVAVDVGLDGKVVVNGQSPEIQIVRLDTLRMDYSYQRDPKLSMTKVRRMIADWSPLAANTLIVNIRANGVPYCVDGGHRVIAMELLDIAQWACWVFHDLTVKEEADIWNKVNGNRTTPRPFQLYRSLLTAQNPLALQVQQVLDQVGIRVVKSSDSPNTLAAISSVMQIADRLGPNHLTATLNFLRLSWPNDPETTGSGLLMGGSDFLNRYADFPHLARDAQRKLSKFTSVEILQWARGKQRLESGHKWASVSEAFYNHYNRGRRTGMLPNRYSPSHDGFKKTPKD